MNSTVTGALIGAAMLALTALIIRLLLHLWDRGMRRIDERDWRKAVSQVDEAPSALPVDSQDPPRFLTFRPKNGYRRNCDCHSKPLVDGDTVLFWPTGSGIVVFCEDGVRENVAAE